MQGFIWLEGGSERLFRSFSGQSQVLGKFDNMGYDVICLVVVEPLWLAILIATLASS